MEFVSILELDRGALLPRNRELAVDTNHHRLLSSFPHEKDSFRTLSPCISLFGLLRRLQFGDIWVTPVTRSSVRATCYESRTKHGDMLRCMEISAIIFPFRDLEPELDATAIGRTGWYAHSVRNTYRPNKPGPSQPFFPAVPSHSGEPRRMCRPIPASNSYWDSCSAQRIASRRPSRRSRGELHFPWSVREFLAFRFGPA